MTLAYHPEYAPNSYRAEWVDEDGQDHELRFNDETCQNYVWRTIHAAAVATDVEVYVYHDESKSWRHCVRVYKST